MRARLLTAPFLPLLLPLLSVVSSSTVPLAAAAAAAADPPSSKEIPGFVNNGTVGSLVCNLSKLIKPHRVGGVVAVGGVGGDGQKHFFNYQSTIAGLDCPESKPPTYPFNEIHLASKDDSIRATFVPYGALISQLWVKDRYGNWRDLVLGFDNTTNYATDGIHPNFGPIVGRYANRIRNGTFTYQGRTYHTPLNENGLDTLHGGLVGYDRSNFTVKSLDSDSVTFEIRDPDGNQGFPGNVVANVKYSLGSGSVWEIEMEAESDSFTPLMLSSHVYWNLEAYNETSTILDHVLEMKYADKYVETDSILIPTGKLPEVQGTPFDFRKAKSFRSLFDRTEGVCGYGCKGWDSCFVMSHPPGLTQQDEDDDDRQPSSRDLQNRMTSKPVLEMHSPKSGIKLSVQTDQPAIQIYTCDGISSPKGKGSLPRKRSHGGDGSLSKIYENHSCVVIEMEDYIDGINHQQEWNRDQFYGPGRPYSWRSVYTFSNVDEQGRDLGV
ncbi:galactose mutarotase-like protein [Violaceomyces palustris]|uniref:Galactose mutarotase-like protein n=1 Tax=Violaceomyces palustris TaxID=1673888 RepID=A0ACD0P8B5_9BASI|nr:galactose mutarotase-like protein [Violaceomyces palustris]